MATAHDVRVLAMPDSMHRINFRDRIEMVPGELSDARALKDAVEGVDIVFHAALIGPPPPLPPERYGVVNDEGTGKLIAACAGKVKRFVLMTSSAVYAPHGKPGDWPVGDDAPRAPSGGPVQHAYGASLIAAEDQVMAAGARGDFEYTILRPTIVAGRKSALIEGLLGGILGQPDAIAEMRQAWGVMQWAHGSDIASAALMAAEDPRAANQSYLVAGQEPVTPYDVQAELWDIMNTGRPDNPFREVAERNNIGLEKYVTPGLRALGWAPKVGIMQCIGEVLGRMEFYSSAAIKMPAHLLDE